MSASAEKPEEAVELRLVKGPSPLAGGWRRALDLLILIASTEFKRAYFGTRLGYVWSIARPLMLFGVLLAVFTQAFHLGAQVPHYPVLLLLGIVLFGFFQDATGVAVSSIVSQESIVRKTQFPRLVIPVSVVLTSLFNLIPNLIVVLGFAIGFGITPSPRWLELLGPLLALIVLAVAVASMLSALYPRFRDIAIVWSVASTALFYASPVIYPLEHVSRPLRTILAMNPIAPILALARRAVIQPDAPSPSQLAGGSLRLLIPLAIYAAVCAASYFVFRREAPRIAESL